MNHPTASLGDLAEITSGFAFKSEQFNSLGNGLPLVRIRDVVDGSSDTYYSGDYKSEFMVLDGDALIGMDGQFNLSIWRGGRALLNQRVCKVSAVSKRLDQSYLLRFLPAALKEIEDKTPFVTVKHLSVKTLREIAIPLPPLPEQRRIAAILDKADALRATRREVLAKIDQLLRSVFLDMFGEPLANPKNWETRRLEDVIKFTGGSQPPKTVFSNEPKPGYVRLVQIRDFRTDKYATYIPESLARRRFSKEDVMIGRYGPPVFQIFRGLHGSYNVALMKAEPKKNVDAEYLFYLLNDVSIQKTVIANSERSAGQSGVNLDFLHEIEIGLPPLELQKKFSHVAKSINSKREFFTESDMQINRLFCSLQQRAFAGTL